MFPWLAPRMMNNRFRSLSSSYSPQWCFIWRQECVHCDIFHLALRDLENSVGRFTFTLCWRKSEDHLTIVATSHLGAAFTLTGWQIIHSWCLMPHIKSRAMQGNNAAPITHWQCWQRWWCFTNYKDNIDDRTRFGVLYVCYLWEKQSCLRVGGGLSFIRS